MTLTSAHRHTMYVNTCMKVKQKSIDIKIELRLLASESMWGNKPLIAGECIYFQTRGNTPREGNCKWNYLYFEPEFLFYFFSFGFQAVGEM